MLHPETILSEFLSANPDAWGRLVEDTLAADDGLSLPLNSPVIVLADMLARSDYPTNYALGIAYQAIKRHALYLVREL
jgi:hypothetical protein